MSALDSFLTHEFLIIALVFCRIGAALMVLPAFGEPYVLSRARLGVALAIALLIGLPISSRLTLPPPEALNIPLLVIAEIVCGILIGAIIRLVMLAIHFAGSLIAMQSGLAAAAFFDPQEATQGTLTGNFLATLALVIIVVADAHLLILQALTASFSVIEVSRGFELGALLEVLVDLGGRALATGFRMAAPVVLLSLLFYLLLGVLNRLMPSFQVLFVAMPVQIALALGIIMLSLGAIVELAAGLLTSSITWLDPV